MNNYDKFQIPGVKIVTTPSGMPIMEIANPLASAKIALNGAHIFSYIPTGEKDLLWLSEKSYFEPGKPIRGGIPVCWPWFGGERENVSTKHGFVRQEIWKIGSVRNLADGATQVVLSLSSQDGNFELSEFPFTCFINLVIGKKLEISFTCLNQGTAPVKVSGALHTYFAISNLDDIAISGLDQVSYQENAANAPHVDGWVQNGDIKFKGEVDRIYCPTQDTVKIVDPNWGRVIRVEKFGSNSTVVWNPAAAKAARMPDYGDDEYHYMCCVECANCRADGRWLEPGIPYTMGQKISLD